MNHIVERLVDKSKSTAEPLSSLLLQAANEIARLQQKEADMLAAGDRLEGQLFSVAKQRDALRISAEEREALEIASKILVSEPSINPAQRKEWATTLLGIIRKEKNDE